jgi:hypothetical protein
MGRRGFITALGGTVQLSLAAHTQQWPKSLLLDFQIWPIRHRVFRPSLQLPTGLK